MSDLSPVRPGSRFETGRLSALCVLIGLFYFWTARTSGGDWGFGREQSDYYNLLVDGWLDGQLHMKVDVPAELLALADPYDPALRPPGLGLHDASFYKGKYYVYFGAAPALLLMLPFRALTGVDLPLPVAILIFAYGGFLMSAGLWVSLKRRYFPNASRLTTGLVLVALSTCSMVPLLLRRPSIWELPLSGAYFFGMVALACVYRSGQTTRRETAWLAGASLALGLAIASRPTYLFGGLLLVVPALRHWVTRREPGGKRRMGNAVLAGAGPVVFIGVAMAAYNIARFDDPLEFGVRYQFSGIYEAKARHFSVDYLIHNLRLYFFQPAEWAWYFPFLHATRPPPFPVGYFGFEFVFGLLVGAPVLWLALFTPMALVDRSAAETRSLRLFMLAAAGMAVGTILILACFYAAMGRYQVDFAPTLVLLAGVGALALERRADAAGRWVRWTLKSAVRAALVISIGFGLCASVALYGNLLRWSPQAFARLAMVANQPAAWIERVVGSERGPIELEVRLPSERRTEREALLVTGSFGVHDAIFIEYQETGDVRVGLAHSGGTEKLSRSLKLDRTKSQRWRVELGSLLPPEAHPLYRGMDDEARWRLTRHLRVEIDGDVVLDGYQRFHPAVSLQPRIAPEIGDITDLAAFSGNVRVLGRDMDLGQTSADDAGRFVLRVLFENVPIGEWQRLFSAETTDGAVAFVSRRNASDQLQLGFMTSDSVVRELAPMSADMGGVHELEWSVIPADRGGAKPAPRVLAKIDGVAAGTWTTTAELQLDTAKIGDAPSGGFGSARGFSGVVHGAEFIASEVAAEFRAVRLRVRFPEGRIGAREPLVVTGEPGRGDQVFVEYLDAGAIRFGLDHWGKPTRWSERVSIRPGETHELEIALGSFGDAKKTGRVDVRPAEVWLNQRRVWRLDTRLYPAERRDVFVARNPIGGSACGPLFTGSVLAVEYLAETRSDAP